MDWLALYTQGHDRIFSRLRLQSSPTMRVLDPGHASQKKTTVESRLPRRAATPNCALTKAGARAATKLQLFEQVVHLWSTVSRQAIGHKLVVEDGETAL